MLLSITKYSADNRGNKGHIQPFHWLVHFILIIKSHHQVPQEEQSNLAYFTQVLKVNARLGVSKQDFARMYPVAIPHVTNPASKAPCSAEIHWDSELLPLRLEPIFAQLTCFSVCPSCTIAH